MMGLECGIRDDAARPIGRLDGVYHLLLALAISCPGASSKADDKLQTVTPAGSLQAEDAGEAKSLKQNIDQLEGKGKYAEAEPLHRKILVIQQKALGENHPDTARAYYNLGDNLDRQEKYAEAESFYRHALVIQLKLLSEDHPDTALTLRDLAVCLDNQEKNPEAEPIFRKVLAISLKTRGADHPETAEALNDLAVCLDGQEKYVEAEALYRKAIQARLRTSGENNAEAAETYYNLADNLDSQRKYPEAESFFRKALAIQLKVLGEEQPDTSLTYHNLAVCLVRQSKFAEAEPLYRKALAIRLKTLGEQHRETAVTLGCLAVCLDSQKKYVEAESIYRRVLQARRKTLGEDDLETALTSESLADILFEQGNYAGAEPLYRTALAVRLKKLGETHELSLASSQNLAFTLRLQDKAIEAEALFRKILAIRSRASPQNHLETGSALHGLALTLNEQGKYAEAEAAFRRALAIRLKVLGEEHRNTASSYHNLAANLEKQGKSVEAEIHYRKALGIRLKLWGEGALETAESYHALAANLDGRRECAAAEILFRKALAIKLGILGEDHNSTAYTNNGLAINLDHQGKLADAEVLYRTALASRLKTVGENHVGTAFSYHNLAATLERQGKNQEAEALYHKALAIWVKLEGENHPDAAFGWNSLADNLDTQGRLDEAITCWSRTAEIDELNRRAGSASGLERALVSDRPALDLLAIALARKGMARAAWARWETNLARGLLDDYSAQQLRPMTDVEHERNSDLARRLQRMDEQIVEFSSQTKRTVLDDQRLAQLRLQQSDLRAEFVAFQLQLEERYQAFAGKPSSCEEIQCAVPDNAALVGWVCSGTRDWACVVRSHGDPVWVEIVGSGKDGRRTDEELALPGRVRTALSGRQATWLTLAKILARQWLDPLEPHLKGVRHLIVLPSKDLARIPLEVLIAARPPEQPRYRVTYAPSGSMFARLGVPRSKPKEPARLLALGDPSFPAPLKKGPAPTPPDHGVPVIEVANNSIGDLFGVTAGDVLIEYNGKLLGSQSDLAVVPAGDKVTRVPLKLWRDGEIRSLEVAAGPLGIKSSNERPTAQVVLASRAAAEVLQSSTRGENLTALPGTRREVLAIAALFPPGCSTTLLGSEATESNIQRLAQSRELRGFRFIHLATHGKSNPSVALSSSLFLAAEPEQRDSSSANRAAGDFVPDARVTAQQIVQTWDLDADLVVLSACQSGLGRYSGGEGYLGFSQALFVKGARSIVLSLWKVDDLATALLMERFYQNLLGKRADLEGPLPKTQALDKAKSWLRGLTAGELDRLRRKASASSRGPVEDLPPPAGSDAAEATAGAESRPFAHPYYWAAFILIGNPT
jgi:CHAT domain-containing protein